MQDLSRLRKLLETASHTSTPDNERLAALNAFRRISDKSGGLDQFFPFSNPNLKQALEELETLKAAMGNTLLENAQLKMERDVLLERMKQHLHRQSKAARPSPSRANSRRSPEGGEAAVRAALSNEWQELHRIHETAKIAGFTGTSADTKKHLSTLSASNMAQHREQGTFPDDAGDVRWRAQCWRLKPGWTRIFNH